MPGNWETFKALQSLLEKECELYVKYNGVLSQERAHLSKFDSEKILLLSAERERLCDLMKEAQAQRRELIKQVSGSSRLKVTDFIAKYFSGQEAQLLLGRVERLRLLIHQTQSRGTEFSQVVNFAIKLIGGLVSIIWSATQNVVRSYTAGGKLKETYHPTGPRSVGVVKEV